MARKCVYLDDVKKLFYKQHVCHNFDEGTEIIEDGFMEKLNQLETFTVDDCKDEFKIGQEVWIPEFESDMPPSIISGTIKEVRQLLEIQLYDGTECFMEDEVYRTKELAETAIKEVDGD